ncbi:MAG: DIP1984 family protein [Oscillospiraceae bacterium]|jgi:predicted  nucleic acid-binding Zn-ribbon protein|nr:DIP1984 family protein [Oscillospiraceae bacterium]MBQ1743200.1 DIP1984 family protein [Oscillospiraceae bacterium]MBQ2324534.1 DIP1984 family protein [Oscillospiraceae bacterium]
MKLAEALQERADLNRKIAQLRERLENNAIVQEGEKTPEDPAQLLVELDASIRRLEELMARINKTNTQTRDGEQSITDLIARKDALRVQVDAYRDIISSASQIARRAMRTEIKILSAVDVKALQKKADELSRELREVDNRIQQLNWMTELQ